MFEKTYARNLGNPKGLIGLRISKWLIENIECYTYLEELVDLSKLNKMLEIGFGNGSGIKIFAEKYNIKIHGIEISKLMYKIASRNNKKWIISGKIKLFLGDFESLITEQYDIIFLSNVVYFWSDLAKKIKAINKILKSNGMIVIFMANPEYLMKDKITNTDIFKKYRLDEVIKEYKDIDLKDIRVLEHKKEKGCYYIMGSKY